MGLDMWLVMSNGKFIEGLVGMKVFFWFKVVGFLIWDKLKLERYLKGLLVFGIRFWVDGLYLFF